MKARYKTFSTELETAIIDGETAFGYRPVDPKDITDFLDAVGPEHVIGIATAGDGVIVFYWEEPSAVDMVPTTGKHAVDWENSS